MQSSTAPPQPKIKALGDQLRTALHNGDPMVTLTDELLAEIDKHECKGEPPIVPVRQAAIIGAAGAAIVIGAICLAVGLVAVQWQSDTILSGIEI